MADETVISAPASAPSSVADSPAVAPASAAPTYSPEIQAELDFAKQARQTFEVLQPYAEDIDRFVSDESYREMARNSYKAYETMRQPTKPEMPPEFAPIVDRLDKVSNYVDTLQQRETAAQAAERDASMRATTEYAQRLVAEHPFLAEDNFAGIQMVGTVAAQRGITFEDAWKKYGAMFAAPRQATPPPPRSLRADAGTPGVPSDTSAGKITSPADIAKRMASAMRRGA